jgi:hypothetical protein
MTWSGRTLPTWLDPPWLCRVPGGPTNEEAKRRCSRPISSDSGRSCNPHNGTFERALSPEQDDFCRALAPKLDRQIARSAFAMRLAYHAPLALNPGIRAKTARVQYDLSLQRRVWPFPIH